MAISGTDAGPASTTTPDPVEHGPVGVMGGTFDPIHHGHLRVALDALELLGLSQVRLIPLAGAVHRAAPHAPADLRMAMLEAAVAGRRDLLADDCELRRGGASYTVDTLTALQRRMPGRPLCLLMGSDAFAGFPDWHQPERILQLANLAVLQRPGQQSIRTAPWLESCRVARLDHARPGQVVECRVSQLEIAASDIRARLAAGRSADFLLPDPVLRLIRRHGLYV